MNKVQHPYPLVSVSILTYNHIGRIARAIDSVLSQKVNFQIEIIVGDDHSTDGTIDIIKKYESQFPDMIFGIYHPRKYDTIPGRINNITNLRACRGKYIAMLDGDDYWTNPNKLRMQVDFLEANPDFGLSFHDVIMKFDEAPELDGLYSENHQSLNKLLAQKAGTEFDFDDIFRFGGSCMATSSMVFRRDQVMPLPDWFFEVAAADYSLQLLAADNAKIKYFPNVWGVYSRHEQSISLTYYKSLENLENKLNELAIYKQNFSKKYKPFYFKRVKSNIQFLLGKKYLRNKQFKKGVFQIIGSIQTDPGHSVSRLFKFLGIQ